MLPTISVFKTLLSYIIPLRIKRSVGVNNTMLELVLYRGQWQLGTADALYSDGWRYTPMLSAFDTLKKKLPSVKKVLVLGVGLGSAVMILGRRRLYPDVTLVDHDKTSLEWAIQLLDDKTQKRMQPICTDANEYMQLNKEQYDLVIVDIFENRVVPEFVMQPAFLEVCRKSVSSGGNVVINYIENNKGDWEKIQPVIHAIFPQCNVTQLGINKIVTASDIANA